LELNGEDIRRERIKDRKRRLAELLRLPLEGISFNKGAIATSTPALRLS
jgi:hypothetical protein